MLDSCGTGDQTGFVHVPQAFYQLIHRPRHSVLGFCICVLVSMYVWALASFCCHDKSHDQKPLGKERVLSAYCSRSQCSPGGSQARTSGRDLQHKAQRKATFIYLFIYLFNTQPRIILHQVIIKIIPLDMPTDMYLIHISEPTRR